MKRVEQEDNFFNCQDMKRALKGVKNVPWHSSNGQTNGIILAVSLIAGRLYNKSIHGPKNHAVCVLVNQVWHSRIKSAKPRVQAKW